MANHDPYAHSLEFGRLHLDSLDSPITSQRYGRPAPAPTAYYCILLPRRYITLAEFVYDSASYICRPFYLHASHNYNILKYVC